MPATEMMGPIWSEAPIAAATGRNSAPPCPLRNICRSRLCKTSNTDCPGSRKGN